MQKTVQAMITWVTTKDGGKKKLPLVGSTYSTVSCFEDTKEKFQEEAWSIVAEILTSPDAFNSILANVRFLFDEAPHELLYSGSKFELYESKVIATGIVL